MMTPFPTSLEAFLEPLSEDLPCGPNLEYDPAYLELFMKLIPKEQKVVDGSTGSHRLESEPEPIRWSELERDCRALLQRTRDLRLVLVLMRCRVQQMGSTGLVEGLRLLWLLLERFPADVYPRLDEGGGYDPVPRAVVLSELTDQAGLLADIRRLSFTGTPGIRLDIREIERALSIPRPEDALLPETVLRQLDELRLQQDETYMPLMQACALLRKIDTLLSEQLGQESPVLDTLLSLLGRLFPEQHPTAVEDIPTDRPDEAPDMSELLSDTNPGTVDSDSTCSDISFDPEADIKETGGAAQRNVSLASATVPEKTVRPLIEKVRLVRAGSIPDRQFAKEQIHEIRIWFETNEPSSPISLLLRQSEQLVGRRFVDVVDVLPSELMHKWDNDPA